MTEPLEQLNFVLKVPGVNDCIEHAKLLPDHLDRARERAVQTLAHLAVAALGNLLLKLDRAWIYLPDFEMPDLQVSHNRRGNIEHS